MNAANDNEAACPYEVREGNSGGKPHWYVSKVETRRKAGNQDRLSVYFPTPEQARHCIMVLIADDQRRA